MGNMKVYFNNGDTVVMKQLEGPEMVVSEVKLSGRGDNDKMLLGIECIWYDKMDVLHRHLFNDKDLEIVKKR